MKIQYILLAPAFIFCIANLNAQIVTEEIHFDNYIDSADNDFENWFSGGAGMLLLQTDGITGGCLSTPDFNNWGNDNARYCSKYIGGSGSTNSTSICFRFDTSLVNSSTFDRATSIWLIPQSDFNHYLIASVAHNQTIEILSYSWTNNPGPFLALENNHWYMLQLSTVFSGVDQIDVGVEVHDLGTSGTSNPFLIASDNGSFNDLTMFNDTAIEVSVTGAKWGGAAYLDDFHYEGIKSADSCVITLPNSVEAIDENGVEISFQNEILTIKKGDFQNAEIMITNLNGQKILRTQITSVLAKIELHHLPAGIYFVTMRTPQNILSAKFVVE